MGARNTPERPSEKRRGWGHSAEQEPLGDRRLVPACYKQGAARESPEPDIPPPRIGTHVLPTQQLWDAEDPRLLLCKAETIAQPPLWPCGVLWAHTPAGEV